MAQKSEESEILIALKEKRLLVSVIGRGLWNKSKGLKDLIFELIEKGCDDITVDFKKCSYIDSTFIGTLAAIYMKVHKKYTTSVKIYGVSESILKPLQTMGLAPRFEIIETIEEKEYGEQFKLDDIETSRIEEMEYMIQAHKTLEEIDGSNKARFQNVTNVLESALKLKKATDKKD